MAMSDLEKEFEELKKYKDDFENTRNLSNGKLTSRTYAGIIRMMDRLGQISKIKATIYDLKLEKRRLEQSESVKAPEVVKRLSDINEELELNQEALDAHNSEVVNQVDTIKESLIRFRSHELNGEKITLRQRIKNLFKEQGVTIGSIIAAILTTLGWITTAIVLGIKAAAKTLVVMVVVSLMHLIIKMI